MANEQTPDTNENALSNPADQGPERFLGLQTRDGEVLTDKPAKPADKPRAAAKVQGDDDLDDDHPDQDESEQDDAPKHKSAQKRINKAVARQRTAERARAEAEQKFTALEARLAAIESGSKPATKAGAGDEEAPNPDDFEYGELDVKFVRAMARYEAKQEFASQSKQSQQSQQSQQQAAAVQEWKKKVDDYIDRGVELHEDFAEVVQDGSFKASQSLAELALESEFGPDIIYEAANDPKECKRISSMSAAKQAAWFGRKEAELSSESSDAAEENGEDENPTAPDASPKTTKAPRPPAKSRGNGATQAVSADTNDFAAFERLATATK